MEVKSVQKYIITSPKKMREVVSMIKKLSPVEAYDTLPFLSKKASVKLRKVIGSALANARQKELKEELLYFKEIQIGEGPRLKRWRAGARGMAKPYKRRMSHIRVVLGVKEVDKKQDKKVVTKEVGRKVGSEKIGITKKKRKDELKVKSAEKSEVMLKKNRKEKDN